MPTDQPPNAHETRPAGEEAWRKSFIIAVSFACLLIAAMIPCPSLVTPHGGPDWSNRLGHIRHDVPEAVLAYASEHGGRYPDSLGQLLPQARLYPCRETFAAKRAWESRPHWHWLRWSACALVIFWMSLLRRRTRGGPLALLSALTVAAVVFAIHLAWVSLAGGSSYAYLDFFRTLPGVQAPVPPVIPLVWVDDPFGHSRREYTYVDDDGWIYDTPVFPFDIDEADALARMPTVDTADLCHRAASGSAEACLALALRREPSAADVFAQIPLNHVARQIALWGLFLLNDPRTGEFALASLPAEDEDTRAYAATVLARVPTQGATAALLELLDGKPTKARPSIVSALGADGDSQALAYLDSIVNGHWRHHCLHYACEALTRMDADASRAVLAKKLGPLDRDDHYRAQKLFAAIARAGDAAVPILAPFATDYDRGLRGPAVAALGTTRSDKALEPMLAMARRLSYEEQAALRKLPASAKARLLGLAVERLAGQPTIETQRLAAEMLGCTDSPDAVAPLLSLARDGVNEAIWGLARLPAVLSADPLAGLLDDPDRKVVTTAARALASVGDPRGIPIVRENRRAADQSTRDLLTRLDAYRRYIDEHPVATARPDPGTAPRP
ncbi:hypothetical protein HQ560_18410 [bacterium]|nr:hypothetical protein [bacterium]